MNAVWGCGRLADVFSDLLIDDSLHRGDDDGLDWNDITLVVNRDYMPVSLSSSDPATSYSRDKTTVCLPSGRRQQAYSLEGFVDPNRDKLEIYVPVGYKNMNKDREGIYKKLKEYGWRVKSFTHHSSALYHATDYGGGNIILDNCRIQTGAKMGTGNFFYSNSHLGHHSTVGDFNYFTTSSVVCGGVTIGNNCFIGASAVLCPDVVLEDEVIVGAGAVVSKNLKKGSVAIAGLNNIIDKKSWEINLK